MIPFNPNVFLYFYIAEQVLWIAPLFIFITILLVLRIFYLAHKNKISFLKQCIKRKIFSVITFILFLLSIILSTISFEVLNVKTELNELSAQHNEQYRYQQMRRNFVLEHDHLYGEFIFPKGTLINRYDPSDNGEETYPLVLSGLNKARFAEPVKIAGVIASAIDSSGAAWIELAEDQNVGPVHFYSTKFGEYGGWMVDRTTSTIFCSKGSVALFEKPLGPDLDLNDEEWWKDKDGAEAHFQPSEWQFRYCDDSYQIEILPAYNDAIDESIPIEKESQSQLVVKDGVLMDAEPIEIEISFYLEALGQYFGAQKSGLESDYVKAYQLFQQAERQNEREAYYYLGIMNVYGQGIPKNREEALYWFNKAAETGSNDAIAQMGRMYFEDNEMQDYDRALIIFNEAAGRGNLVAEFYLGLMYEQGLGVEQDYSIALAWFKKASHPIHAAGMTGVHPLSIQAMINIGRIYAEGLLSEKNPKAAEPWFEKACYLDSEQACELWESIKMLDN